MLALSSSDRRTSRARVIEGFADPVEHQHAAASAADRNASATASLLPRHGCAGLGVIGSEQCLGTADSAVARAGQVYPGPGRTRHTTWSLSTADPTRASQLDAQGGDFSEGGGALAGGAGLLFQLAVGEDEMLAEAFAFETGTDWLAGVGRKLKP